MSWMMIEGEELVRLKRRINETGWRTNCLTAGRARVSFYANGNLLYLKGESGTARLERQGIGDKPDSLAFTCGGGKAPW
jgi:hypothetical protein